MPCRPLQRLAGQVGLTSKRLGFEVMQSSTAFVVLVASQSACFVNSRTE
jgi:hypothetical protein